MKTEKQIREEIKRVTELSQHVLDWPAASSKNIPRMLHQFCAVSMLDAYYFVLNEKRPQFTCDKEKNELLKDQKL